jgi:FAD:protein FMN transferase
VISARWLAYVASPFGKGGMRGITRSFHLFTAGEIPPSPPLHRGGTGLRGAHLVALSLVALSWLTACGEKPAYKQQSFVFGTLVEVSVHGEAEAKAKAAVDYVLADFDAMHRQLHAWEPSDLERLNTAIAARATRITAAPGLGPLLADAARYSARGDFLFNPAIGNLIRLWGFHSDTFEPRLPPAAEVERLVKANPRLTDLTIEGDTVVSSNPAVRTDLGGYAKGLALDRAAGYLRAQGIHNALVNIGGNIIALGSHGKRPWKIGIQHPRQPGAIAMLELRDGEAIGTSGDYQRYFEVDGQRYCHLIDPRTGWPAQSVQAVTVLTRGAQAGVRSDVSSKPLFIAGPEGWRAMATKIGITDVLFIDAQGHIQVTPPLAGRLEWAEGVLAPANVP